MKLFLGKIIVAVDLVILGAIFPVSTLALDNYPKGVINDPYSGDCARYIGTDGDGICGYPKLALEDRIKSIEKISEKKAKSVENGKTETGSAKNNTPLPKPLLAVVIIVVNLAGILLYTSYKNSRSKKI